MSETGEEFINAESIREVKPGENVSAPGVKIRVEPPRSAGPQSRAEGAESVGRMTQDRRSLESPQGLLGWLAKRMHRSGVNAEPVLQDSLERSRQIQKELKHHLGEGNKQVRQAAKEAGRNNNPALESLRREAEEATAKSRAKAATPEAAERAHVDYRTPEQIAFDEGAEEVMDEIRRELAAEREHR